MARKKAPDSTSPDTETAATEENSGGTAVMDPVMDPLASNVMEFGTDSEIPVELISASPLNPRKWFDPEELQQLANSLKTHGQLQNLTVRRMSNGLYDLIGGERRLRAAQLADLPTLRCRVIECDDATAIELRGIENYRRSQLNAIEEALWFQQMIDTGRFNQTSLASHLGITPGQVSNRIRLLKLPDEFQQLIGSGQLPATHARSLVPWVDRPTILQALKDEKILDKINEMSVDDFEQEIAEAATEVSRGMEESYWNGPRFEVTDAIRKDLDLVEVKELYTNRKRPRAFNVELWDRLQAEANAQREAQRLQEDAEDDEGSSGKQERDGSVSRLDDWQLTRVFRDHMTSVLAGHIKADAFGMRVFLLVECDGDFISWLGERAGAEDDVSDASDMWTWTADVTPKNLPGLMVEFLQSKLATSGSGYMPLQTLKMICDDGKINPFDKWQPDAELLDLCSDDQLRELFTESMAPESKVKKWGRARLLKEALESWPAGYLPALLTPRALMSPTHIGASDSDEDDSDDDE